MLDIVLVTLAAALAGFIDAMVGGGGLVLVPAMFSVFPQAAPATLFGTNKGAAIWGTAWATLQYARRVELDWSSLGPAAVAALAGAAIGAWLVTLVPPDGLRVALPFVLAAVFLYTLMKPSLGTEHAPRLSRARSRWVAVAIGLGLGLYDGFFGPGTGSLLVFLFVRLLGYDFLHASASAKLLNTATNGAALTLFAATGHVWWGLALTMAVANVAGSFLGTRVALTRGSAFVRQVFILVVGALILRTAYDAWRLPLG